MKYLIKDTNLHLKYRKYFTKFKVKFSEYKFIKIS